MNATEEKPQQINGVEIGASSVLDSSGVNKARTGAKSDAPLTHPCSLIVLAQQLARQRSSLPPQRRPLVSNLIQQIYNYDANPDAMRPRILATITRIETAA